MCESCHAGTHGCAFVLTCGVSSLLQETAAVLRKLWSHPGSGEAARLQLIIGNTLERRMGPEALAALLKDVCRFIYKMSRLLKRGYSSIFIPFLVCLVTRLDSHKHRQKPVVIDFRFEMSLQRMPSSRSFMVLIWPEYLPTCFTINFHTSCTFLSSHGYGPPLRYNLGVMIQYLRR